MKTFKRICIQNFTITDEDGTSFTIKRGEEYITSAIGDTPSIICTEKVKDQVVVFSQYWVHVPADIFAGAIEFT